MSKFFVHKVRRFLSIGIIKTIIINFRLLPFRDAIKFPIIATRSTYLFSLTGRMIIDGPVTTGMIRFGFFNSDFCSWKEHRIFLNINGTIKILGKLSLGVGTKLIVADKSYLEIGDNALIGANVKIICRNQIKIGKNLRCAWESQIIDTNFHYIVDIKKNRVVSRVDIIDIGDNNWIGNRSTISPGTRTPNFFIIASNSLCNKNYKSFIDENSIVAGTPAKLIKTDVYRALEREEKRIEQMFGKEDKFIEYYSENFTD